MNSKKNMSTMGRLVFLKASKNKKKILIIQLVSDLKFP